MRILLRGSFPGCAGTGPLAIQRSVQQCALRCPLAGWPWSPHQFLETGAQTIHDVVLDYQDKATHVSVFLLLLFLKRRPPPHEQSVEGCTNCEWPGMCSQVKNSINTQPVHHRSPFTRRSLRIKGHLPHRIQNLAFVESCSTNLSHRQRSLPPLPYSRLDHLLRHLHAHLRRVVRHIALLVSVATQHFLPDFFKLFTYFCHVRQSPFLS